MKTNNELIAEFLGYTKPHPDYPNTTYWYKENKEPLCVLMFDSDLNWLFKVVKKITETELYNFELWYSGNAKKEWLCSFEVQMTNKADRYGITTRSGKTQIEAVYKAVIEFIKHYNLTTKLK